MCARAGEEANEDPFHNEAPVRKAVYFAKYPGDKALFSEGPLFAKCSHCYPRNFPQALR